MKQVNSRSGEWQPMDGIFDVDGENETDENLEPEHHTIPDDFGPTDDKDGIYRWPPYLFLPAFLA